MFNMLISTQDFYIFVNMQTHILGSTNNLKVIKVLEK